MIKHGNKSFSDVTGNLMSWLNTKQIFITNHPSIFWWWKTILKSSQNACYSISICTKEDNKHSSLATHFNNHVENNLPISHIHHSSVRITNEMKKIRTTTIHQMWNFLRYQIMETVGGIYSTHDAVRLRLNSVDA